MEKKTQPSMEEFLVLRTEREKTLMKWLVSVDLVFLFATFILSFVAEKVLHLRILSLSNYSVLAIGNVLLFVLIFLSFVRGYKTRFLKYMIALYGPLLIMMWMYLTDPQYAKSIFGFLPLIIFATGIGFYEEQISLISALGIATSFGFLLFHYFKIGFSYSFYEIALSYIAIFMSLGTAYFFVPRIRLFLIELIAKRRETEEARQVLEIKVKARTRELEELTQSLEEKVRGRTKELQKRVDQLERFSTLTIGRELKMLDLKKRIKELEGKIKNPQV